jgi:hypothetical protein
MLRSLSREGVDVKKMHTHFSPQCCDADSSEASSVGTSLLEKGVTVGVHTLPWLEKQLLHSICSFGEIMKAAHPTISNHLCNSFETKQFHVRCHKLFNTGESKRLWCWCSSMTNRSSDLFNPNQMFFTIANSSFGMV